MNKTFNTWGKSLQLPSCRKRPPRLDILGGVRLYQYSNTVPRLSEQNCKVLSFLCLFDTKKTPPNKEVCPESLGANKLVY